MNTIFYYMLTFAEAAAGFVGIRSVYEQPHYAVVQHLGHAIEVRDYAPRLAVETDETGDGREAFMRLFRYITGENAGSEKIAMTAPVSRSGEKIAMTAPVQVTEGGMMRFFLPQDVAANGAPNPLDPAVRLVRIPAQRIAAIRFSGVPDAGKAREMTQILLDTLRRSNIRTEGTPYQLTYDAPFTLPFVRRNEVAVAVAP